MVSVRARLTMLLLHAQKQTLMRRHDNTALMRRMLNLAARAIPMPANIRHEQRQVAGIWADRLVNTRVSARRNRILVYLHGGGFVVGNPATHRAYAARLGQWANASEIWLPDYRLAPEHPFPAAPDDVLKFWRELTKHNPQNEYLLAGESAGGGLSLALCISAQEQKLRMPERLYLLSPWLDLTIESQTHFSLDRRDPFLGRKMIERYFARHYAGNTPRNNPQMSPLFADFYGLPPTLVQVGSREILLDDSRRFARKATDHGVDVTLEVHNGLWHAWPVFQTAPESHSAIRRAGKWLANEHAGSSAETQVAWRKTG